MAETKEESNKKPLQLNDEELKQVTGGKVRGVRDTSVSFDDCPQEEDFRTDVCLRCEHFEVCWPTGMINSRQVN